jgi:hypothetical protein
MLGNMRTESQWSPTRIQGILDDSDPLKGPNKAGQTVTYTGTDLLRQSVFGTNDVADNKILPEKTGLGLAQWTEPGRRKGLFEHVFEGRAGVTAMFDIDAQIDYLVHELKTSPDFKGLEHQLETSHDVNDLTRRFSKTFENPDPRFEGLAGRQGTALRARTNFLKSTSN